MNQPCRAKVLLSYEIYRSYHRRSLPLPLGPDLHHASVSEKCSQEASTRGTIFFAVNQSISQSIFPVSVSKLVYLA
jgi:hypothetical protein